VGSEGKSSKKEAKEQKRVEKSKPTDNLK